MSLPVQARYRLVRTIASGGMAQVYDAWWLGERGFERRVAIKRVLPELFHDTAIRRMFLDEARIASHLHHGHIAQVLDYGTIDGAEFIAMEFVDGLDARKAGKRGMARGTPMPVGVALHIVSQVAHALDYAHNLFDENGSPLSIVHRDVTPQNVLLSWAGDVKLSDFGIAMAANRDERTATGVVKGKIGFIAPEQLVGRAVGGPADVFALGATLHALLTGESPFRQDVSGGPGLLAVSPELPAQVAQLVSDCMATNPAARPDARAVAARAAALEAESLPGDGRSALRDWLSGLHGDDSTHALDDLMRLALVPVSPSDPHTLRVQPVEATPQGVTTGKPGGVRARWVLLALALAGTAAAGAMRLGREPVVAPPADGPPASVTPPAREVQGAASVAAESSSEPAASQAPPAQKRRVTRSRPAVRARRTGAAAEAAGAVGWLRVGGAAWLGARVSIDGRPVGLAPLEQVLPVGRHSIRIELGNGRGAAVERAVAISSAHTRLEPLQLMR